MRLAFVSIGLTAALFAVGCGDDDGVGAAGSGGDGGQGGEGGQPAPDGGSGGGGGDPVGPIDCGEELVCEAGTACIEEPIEPDCTDLGKGEVCPEGTTETVCGGAGFPCCCEPTPAPEYRCADASACAGELSCECLDPCTDSEECTSLAGQEGVFRCELPAVP